MTRPNALLERLIRQLRRAQERHDHIAELLLAKRIEALVR